ncbi:Uncharacterised protein [uncultured archaeon]|nr:Uncharacterised protein [uncultured archaeon]
MDFLKITATRYGCADSVMKVIARIQETTKLDTESRNRNGQLNGSGCEIGKSMGSCVILKGGEYASE